MRITPLNYNYIKTDRTQLNFKAKLKPGALDRFYDGVVDIIQWRKPGQRFEKFQKELKYLLDERWDEISAIKARNGEDVFIDVQRIPHEPEFLVTASLQNADGTELKGDSRFYIVLNRNHSSAKVIVRKVVNSIKISSTKIHCENYVKSKSVLAKLLDRGKKFFKTGYIISSSILPQSK